MTAPRAVAVRSSGTDPVVENVRAASDVVEVVGQYVSLKKVGRTWKGLCPFHQEKTPSFIVSPDRQTFHCFGCGQGGDVFRFVMEVEKVGFPEALRSLADRAGIRLPTRRGDDAGARIAEACEAAATLYRRFLDDSVTGAVARDFLSRRGIEGKSAERFGLGYAPPGWDTLSSRLRRLGEETLVRAGLAVGRESGGIYDRFRDRLIVPLREPNGRAVGFGGRSLGDEEPKYLNSPETELYHKGRFVFALGEAREALRRSGEALLVEGYFDVIALHQAGIEDAVASSGTAITEEQGARILRSAARVCLALDGDAAGQAAAQKALPPLLASGLEVRIAVLPKGDDPDTLVRREGASAIARLREQALRPAQLLCRNAGLGVEEKRRATESVLDLARGLSDLPRREALLQDADAQLGTGIEQLRAALAGGSRPQRLVRAAPPTAAANRASTAPAARTLPPYVERQLIALLVAAPEIAGDAVREVAEAALEHEWTRAVWREIARHPAGGVAHWIDSIDGAAREWLTSLSVSAEAGEEPRRELDDLCRTLAIHRCKRELSEARRRVGVTEGDEQREWLQRVQTLKGEATRLQSEYGGVNSMRKGAGE